ncbi:hypothetical protein GE09DRAFT_973231 [Coniochaeta sp. 2T2.1]|nr:hypothetical protein GE09DRAFT_973231 [Coniochaeta sp. 2T2.1]
MRPRRRRNRRKKACSMCRERKIKCDQTEPCASCVKAKLQCIYSSSELQPSRATTYYHSAPQRPHIQLPLPRIGIGNGFRNEEPFGIPLAHDGSSATRLAASLPTPRTWPSPSSNYGKTGESTGHGKDIDRSARLEGDIAQLQREPGQGGSASGQPGEHAPPTDRGVMSKSRYFGQSHWMNTIRFFPLITGVVEKLRKDNDPSYVPLMVKCKTLAKSMKQSRVGGVFSIDIGKSVPNQEKTYRLLRGYFRTFETVYRILHVPTFWEEYRKYWADPATASPAFVIQMQLCMAIGSCFQEDVASLRYLATQWIYEAQFWLAPPEKSRMNLAALQIMCLLHLARESCGIGGDLTWLSSGSLMRCAMYMGLHHDPDKFGNMPMLRSELRRRLWATILEIALQSSLDSGGPPLISPSDYDTKQPGNFDDEQLLDGDIPSSAPRPGASFTQTSVQLALLRSFPTRLSVAQYVNGFRASASYEQTCRLNAQLQHVSASLQHFYDPAGVLPRRMTLFQLRLAEHMVHRFFLALNQPCLGQARTNADYWFARKASVESARKLCEGFLKVTASSETQSFGPLHRDDFGRLSLAGAGAFRSVPIQSMMIIGVELIWQALDDRSIRPGSGSDPAMASDPSAVAGIGVCPRGELLEILASCLVYQEKRISCGETNAKGYIFSRALLTQAQALLSRLPDAELQQLVLDSIRTSLEHCWGLLKEVAGAAATPPAEHEERIGHRTKTGEVPASSQDMGEPLGFGGGWEWEDYQVSLSSGLAGPQHR